MYEYVHYIICILYKYICIFSNEEKLQYKIQLAVQGEGHFGAADSALDNWAPCRFGAEYFGAVSYFLFIFRVMKKKQ